MLCLNFVLYQVLCAASQGLESIHTYACTRLHIHTHACMHTHKLWHAHTQTCTLTHMHTHTHTHHTHTHTNVFTRKCKCTSTHVRTHINNVHSCLHRQVHTFIYVRCHTLYHRVRHCFCVALIPPEQSTVCKDHKDESRQAPLCLVLRVCPKKHSGIVVGLSQLILKAVPSQTYLDINFLDF